jgi:hypothetical protein
MSLVWSVGGQTMVPAYVCWVVCRGTDHGSRGQSVVPWDRPGLQGTDHGSSLSGDRPGLQGTDHGSREHSAVPGDRARFHGSTLPPVLSPDRPFQAGYAPKTLASIASTGPDSWFYGMHGNKYLSGKSSFIYSKMQCLALVAYLS